MLKKVKKKSNKLTTELKHAVWKGEREIRVGMLRVIWWWENLGEHNNVNNKTINELKKKKMTQIKKKVPIQYQTVWGKISLHIAMLPEPQFPNCTMGSISLSVYRSIKQMFLTWLQVGISK